MGDKIRVSWDDLNSRRVDTRVKEQAALARNRTYAAMDPGSILPAASARKVPASLLQKAAVYMALAGLLGGALAWGAGFVLQFKPSAQVEAVKLLADVRKVRDAERLGDASRERAPIEVRTPGTRW